MDSNWRQRLSRLIIERGFSRKSLSRAAGLGETYLRDVIDIGRDPGVEKLTIICDLLGVPIEYVLHGDGAVAQRVPIIGAVAGAVESWIPIDDERSEIELTVGGGGAPIALEVRGDSMRPAYRPGDIIIASRATSGSFQRLLGLDCVVLTKSGERYVKFLIKGGMRHRFNLRSYATGFDDIENVELEWAAPIMWVRRYQR